MQLPWEIFRAYDIRGRALGADAPLTAPLAEAIGRAYGTMLRREWTATQCLIGGDQRSTTPALSAALIEGLRGAGIDVLNIGLAASPLAYWAAARRCEAGLPTAAAVVTASHNPADQNGIKLVWPSTLPLLPHQIRAVAELIERGDFERGVGAIRDWDPIPEYLADLTHLAGNREDESSLTLVTDPGNGVAALTGPAALGAGGARVHVINAELSSAPEHTADPQHAENMQQLQRAVLERSADLGIAWDGDGDRLGVVDARGRRATPDRILALLARAHLERHPGAPIHVDVKVSQAVIEDIRSRGGSAVLGPVGHSLGKHAMQAAGIDFGGEASSHYFQRVSSPAHITDDAVRAACQVVQICSRGLAGETATLEQQLDEIPTWRTSPEVQLPCPDATKFSITAELAAALGRDYRIVTIDGARADCSRIEPGAWALVRASNTTPNLTVRVEAQTDAGYERVRTMLCKTLSQAGVDASPLDAQPPLD